MRPWYAKYPGDYNMKTQHLTLEEHGAYNLLMDYYYATRSPIPDDPDVIARCLDIKAPSMTFISGVTDSGKSYLIRNLVKANCHKYHKIIVICPTLNEEHKDYEYVEQKYVYSPANISCLMPRT